jgi:hypothetical protein
MSGRREGAPMMWDHGGASDPGHSYNICYIFSIASKLFSYQETTSLAAVILV